jgi:xanthine/CO dehydrogenase XdhC/CoxF family maturation factor
MIGSKRRVSAVFELLEKEGYGRELFTHVYAPIGLNIGAETPAEIAVSVLAEIISVRRRVKDDTRSLVQLTGLHPSLRRAKLQPVG